MKGGASIYLYLQLEILRVLSNIYPSFDLKATLLSPLSNISTYKFSALRRPCK